MIHLVRMLWATISRDRDERGASSVEYGLLLSGIAAIIVAAVYAFGGTVSGLFDESCQEIDVSVQSNAC